MRIILATGVFYRMAQPMESRRKINDRMYLVMMPAVLLYYCEKRPMAVEDI